MTSALEYRNGWLWPSADSVAFEVIGREAAQLPDILDHVPADRRRVAVQAGGNCGLMVRPLAAAFEAVYTFEPHPVNFACLVHNLHGLDNVIKLQACVGYDMGTVAIGGWPNGVRAGNTAMTHVDVASLGETGGYVPVIDIDHLGLPALDLLMLDVEGFELQALRGAHDAVTAFRPVIAIELIGHAKRYGDSTAEIKALLDAWGYRPVQRLERDTVFVYGGEP